MEVVAFKSIGFTAALIVNRLRNEAQLSERSGEKDVTENSDSGRDGGNQERSRAHEEYVEHSLRERAAWERRISGNGPARKRR